MKTLYPAIFLTMVSFASAAMAQPPEIRAKSYDVARSILVKAGFKPVNLKHDAGTDFFCEDGFCKRYPEAINCSGTGLSPCQFVYQSQDAKRYLIVGTHGEIKLTVTGSHWARSYEIQDIEQRK